MKNDVTYIAIILGLFVLAFALVAACDRIIGSDEDVLAGEPGGEGPAVAAAQSEQVAA
jgi:hypothetical protein